MLTRLDHILILSETDTITVTIPCISVLLCFILFFCYEVTLGSPERNRNVYQIFHTQMFYVDLSKTTSLLWLTTYNTFNSLMGSNSFVLRSGLYWLSWNIKILFTFPIRSRVCCTLRFYSFFLPQLSLTWIIHLSIISTKKKRVSMTWLSFVVHGTTSK